MSESVVVTDVKLQCIKCGHTKAEHTGKGESCDYISGENDLCYCESFQSVEEAAGGTEPLGEKVCVCDHWESDHATKQDGTVGWCKELRCQCNTFVEAEDEEAGTCACGHTDLYHNSNGACMHLLEGGILCPCYEYIEDDPNAPDWLKFTKEDVDKMTEEERQSMIAFLAKRDIKKNKNKKGEIKCTKCGRTQSVERKMTGIDAHGSMVDLGGPTMHHVECFNYGDCVKHRPSNNTGVMYQNFQKCRHDPTHVFKIGETGFYGGSEAKVDKFDYDDTWLIISCLGAPSGARDLIWARNSSTATYLKPFACSNAFQDIAISWTDMQAPPLKAGFWARVVALAVKQKKDKVLYYCWGGHGRTGTSLAATLIECADMSAKDAYDFIKKNYCKEAIETESQIKYLNVLDEHHHAEKKANVSYKVAAKETKK